MLDLNETGVDIHELGVIEDEEKQFLIIDKDTGKAYDIRNENQIERIARRTTRIT